MSLFQGLPCIIFLCAENFLRCKLQHATGEVYYRSIFRRDLVARSRSLFHTTKIEGKRNEKEPPISAFVPCLEQAESSTLSNIPLFLFLIAGNTMVPHCWKHHGFRPRPMEGLCFHAFQHVCSASSTDVRQTRVCFWERAVAHQTRCDASK